MHVRTGILLPFRAPIASPARGGGAEQSKATVASRTRPQVGSCELAVQFAVHGSLRRMLRRLRGRPQAGRLL